MGALQVKLTQSLINGRSRVIYLVNFLNLTSGQPWTYVQVVRQQNELGIPKRTTVSVEPWVLITFCSRFVYRTIVHMSFLYRNWNWTSRCGYQRVTTKLDCFIVPTCAAWGSAKRGLLKQSTTKRLHYEDRIQKRLNHHWVGTWISNYTHIKLWNVFNQLWNGM